jgi:formate dehydrogenase iron-sulfur subunit
MSAPRIFIPMDSAAVAVGADEVAVALQTAAQARGLHLDIVRTGSRGLFWLEPLVEPKTPEGRIGYGPIKPAEAAGLLDVLLTGGDHAKRVGQPENIPFLKRQTRLTFARCGIIDPLSPEAYFAAGGWRGLEKARAFAGGADRDGQALRPARSRRCGLPRRDQVGDDAARGRIAKIHRLQRR